MLGELSLVASCSLPMHRDLLPPSLVHGLVFLLPSVMDEISVELRPPACKKDKFGQFKKGAKQVTTVAFTKLHVLDSQIPAWTCLPTG